MSLTFFQKCGADVLVNCEWNNLKNVFFSLQNLKTGWITKKIIK